MKNQTMTRAQIEALPTDYLNELYQKNDQETYSVETFELIAQVLQERTGSLPAQTAPAAAEDSESEEAGELLHDEDLLVKISGRARIFSAVLWILAVLFLAGAGANLWGVWPLPTGLELNQLIPGIYGLVSPSIAYAALSAVGALLLQAVAEGIYLLLDIQGKK